MKEKKGGRTPIVYNSKFLCHNLNRVSSFDDKQQSDLQTFIEILKHMVAHLCNSCTDIAGVHRGENWVKKQTLHKNQ